MFTYCIFDYDKRKVNNFPPSVLCYGSCKGTMQLCFVADNVQPKFLN